LIINIAMAFNKVLDTPDKICYFAYGSNMKSPVMEGRGIRPFAVQRLIMPSHVLTFDIFGVPYSEPAMASIAERRAVAEYENVQEPRPAVHGIGYVLSAGDFEKLLVSEGAGTAYKVVELEAYVLVGEGEEANEVNGAITVRTLVGRYPFRPNALPSQRYLVRPRLPTPLQAPALTQRSIQQLLVDGANEHKLPRSYRKYLEALPCYTKRLSRVEDLGARLFLGFWMPIIVWTMKHIKTSASSKSSGRYNGPALVVWLLFNAVWLHYDLCHCWIWGHGGGRR
jgi:hypothetical protein